MGGTMAVIVMQDGVSGEEVMVQSGAKLLGV